MARERKGFVFEREPDNWYARVTFLDQKGKRRDLWRKGGQQNARKGIIEAIVTGSG